MFFGILNLQYIIEAKENVAKWNILMINFQKFKMFFLLSNILLIIFSCGKSRIEVSVDFKKTSNTKTEIEQLTLSAVYPNHSNWNDYVKISDSNLAPYSQSEITCAPGTDIGLQACIHAGERFKATLTSINSCASISAKDSLEVFNWKCVEGNNKITIYSIGLKESKGLKDLIDFSSDPVWKENFLQLLKDGQVIKSSESSIWWNNEVLALPENTGSTTVISDDGSDIGRIFVLNNDSTLPGFEILDSKTAIVINPDFTLFGNNLSSQNCNTTDASSTSPDFQCLLFGTGINHLWIEGNFDITTGGTIYFNDLMFSQIRNSNFKRNGNLKSMMLLGNTNSNKFVNLNFHGKLGNSNIFETKSTTNSNLFYNIQSVTSGTVLQGFYIFGDENIIIKLKAHNNATNSNISVAGNDNIISEVLVANGYSSGFSIASGALRNTLLNITAINNLGYGIKVGNGNHDNLFQNILAVNNESGIRAMGDSFDAIYSDIALMYNTNIGISVQGFNNSFINKLVVGNNGTDCTVISGATSGLIDTTCTDSGNDESNSYSGQSSTATLYTNRDVSSSFVGKVSVTDTENQTNTNGAEAVSSSLDYIHFENFWRTWGVDGSAFPNSNNRSHCSNGFCRIWDNRLSSGDTLLLNHSFDFVAGNEVFTADSICPSAVHGNQTLTNLNSTPSTFLKYATEIMFDDIGNDNGLCESNESCIYSPNFGVYQGEGDYLSNGTCVFQDGTVTGVIMYAYPNNGGVSIIVM